DGPKLAKDPRRATGQVRAPNSFQSLDPVKILRFFSFVALGALAFLAPAHAQLPNSLKYVIPAPFSTAQTGAGLGRSVAVDGTWMVVGAPFDDVGGEDDGVVKVFDSATGALQFIIR